MSFLGANGGGFMGGSSFGGGSGYGMGYGGGMGGMGMGSMYGGGMGMMQQQQQQQQMPQIDPATGQPVVPQGYQFDLRRDIQATIGGMNASLGLAYGLTQMLSLSAIGVKVIKQ